MASTIWKGRLNFGLVSIPIKLLRAARAEKIHMHKLQRETGTRVRQVFVPAEQALLEEKIPGEKLSREPEARAVQVRDDTEPHEELAPTPGLSRADVVHGFEYEKDKYVKFEPEELAEIAPKSSAEMQIVEFVRSAEIDPVYLETSYYVAPDAGGDKPYALLFEVLKKTGYAAIGEFVMHRRDQIMVLRPGEHGMIGHTLFYEDEVKRDREYQAETGLIAEKEMDLAIKLVDALAGPFQPEKFKDQYRERLRQAISQKVERGAITPTESTPPTAPVVDIMAALKESLTKARKPVKSESRPAADKKAKRAGGR
jgi:DNA end-binding protein Ku